MRHLPVQGIKKFGDHVDRCVAASRILLAEMTPWHPTVRHRPCHRCRVPVPPAGSSNVESVAIHLIGHGI